MHACMHPSGWITVKNRKLLSRLIYYNVGTHFCGAKSRVKFIIQILF